MNHDFARQLRRNFTDDERKLWSELRGRRFAGMKFRRQQPIGPYIVDFVCFEKKLIIELDGSQHGDPGNRAADAARTSFLESQGFRVTRYWNVEVFQKFEVVLDTIYRDLLTPSPLAGEGERFNAYRSRAGKD